MDNVSYWVPCKTGKINGFRCLRQSKPMEPNIYEKTLVGKHGEIFENSDNPERKYKVLFYSAIVANRNGGHGAESSIVIPERDVDKYTKILQIYSTWKSQLKRVQQLFGYTCLDTRFKKTATNRHGFKPGSKIGHNTRYRSKNTK